MPRENYRKLLAKRRQWYKSIDKVYRPLLKEDVFFSARGFHHLLYNGLGHARSVKERINRITVLPLAVSIIKTVKNSDKRFLPGDIEYWALKKRVGIKKDLITVILRRKGKGRVIFYSIWRN